MKFSAIEIHLQDLVVHAHGTFEAKPGWYWSFWGLAPPNAATDHHLVWKIETVDQGFDLMDLLGNIIKAE